ncbi:hypothetical protein C3K47_03500 [Solitalea longa]|uniref:DUF4440 domain-containing protein n=1 Tax=Solitalea longa TaxID=2079460 RepID=A0A2S5A797_9SPHI|nr:nuclear transport factor 2 family protein [Solitalea longa]POY38471.1 hypothetical protein C3K47_03500 [Solitalea longa]
MKNVQLLAMLLMVTCACNQSKPLSADEIKQLDAVEKSMFDATTAGDSAAFRKLCGSDYYTINANGEAQTLNEALPAVPRFKGSVAKLSEQKQRIFGNVAFRTGRAKIYVGSQQVAEILYTSGWEYKDDHWQYIHWQGTMAGMMLKPLIGKVSMEPPPLKN